jgi:hypothetical protein
MDTSLEAARDFINEALGVVEETQRDLRSDDLGSAERESLMDTVRDKMEGVNLRLQEALYSFTVPVDFTAMGFVEHLLPDVYRQYYASLHGEWMKEINNGPIKPRVKAAQAFLDDINEGNEMFTNGGVVVPCNYYAGGGSSPEGVQLPPPLRYLPG